jgi:signal peptide peptidase SppA
MNNRLPHLAQRLFNVPLAIQEGKAEIIMAALADRFGVSQMFNGTRPVSLVPADLDEDDQMGDSAYNVVAGVAVIPVEGTLVAKLGSLRPYSGMTGYDGLRQNFLTALGDPAVEAIVFDIDSPGGEVAGMLDLADTIYQARGIKPIQAILTESAYSAAYAIASATDRVIVPRTGGTGSIGCICMHVDMTKAMSAAGLTVTLIRYGAHKMEGNPFEGLSADALARKQAEIDTLGEMFVATVARNRGLTAAAVRATDAECFLGQAGVAIGLADEIASPDEAFRALVNSF